MMRGYGYGYGYGPGSMMGGTGAGLVGLFFMMLFGLVLIAGIVLIIVWAVRSSSRGAGTPQTGAPPAASAAGQDEACRIARERLARGEITLEEYEKLKCALEE